MRKLLSILLMTSLAMGVGAWTWARCSAMSGYARARPEFFFYGPSPAEIAAARLQAKELRRQKTLARIEGIQSLEEQARLRTTERRRDGLEDKFQRAYAMSSEQREKIALELYERGEQSEQRRSIDAAKDYYLFAMQIAPGTDVSASAHQALIRLDEAQRKLAGASRGQDASGAGLLSQAELAEIQKTLHQGDSEADAEKVRLMLEQMTDFSDDKRQQLVIERLRDQPGRVYSDGLIQAIRLANGSAKDAARQALVDRFARMTANTLRNKLAAGEEEGRLAAVKAIAAKNKEELIPDLVQALNDASDDVRQASREALRALTGQDFGPAKGATAVERFVVGEKWKAWLSSRQGK